MKRALLAMTATARLLYATASPCAAETRRGQAGDDAFPFWFNIVTP